MLSGACALNTRAVAECHYSEKAVTIKEVFLLCISSLGGEYHSNKHVAHTHVGTEEGIYILGLGL